MIKINLKQLLKNKNLTLTELSELTGISTNSLGALANGKSHGIQFNTLEKILAATGCRIEELIHNVGSLYTISILEDSNDYTPFINLEEKLFVYNVQFTNENNNIKSVFKIQISVLINKTHTDSKSERKSMYISFKNFTLKNEADKDLSLFINNADESLITALSHLIATQLLWNYQDEGINVNSCVLFSWYTFPKIPRKYYDILIQPVPYEFDFSGEDVDTIKINNMSPCIANIRSLRFDFPNIEEVSHDVKTGKTSISIYTK